MSVERDLARTVRSWLQTDERESASRVLDAVMARLNATPQRRSMWRAWRGNVGDRAAKLAAAGAALVLLAAVGFALFSSQPPAVPAASPTPTSSHSSALPSDNSPSAAPTDSATPNVPPNAGLIAYTVLKYQSIDENSSYGYTRIHVASSDGTQVRELLSDPSPRGEVPVTQDIVGWLPDGSAILYLEGSAGGGRDLVLTSPDGVSETICAARADHCPVVADGSQIAISPDGSRLALVTSEGGDGLAILELSTRELTALDVPAAGGLDPCDSDAGEYWGEPSWSPDGTQLAVASGYWSLRDEFCPSVILILDADGGNVRQLTSAETLAFSPSWSPEGTRILFAAAADSSAAPAVYTIRPDGTDLQLLTDAQISGVPRWTANGRIVVRNMYPDAPPPSSGGPTSSGAWLINADGHGMEMISDANLADLTAIGCIVCPYSQAVSRFSPDQAGDAYWQPQPRRLP